jgi:hypothetical protein
LRKELASYTSDLSAIFELNQSERDNVSIMQSKLDLMVQLSPAMRQMAQDQIDLARATQELTTQSNKLTMLWLQRKNMTMPPQLAVKHLRMRYNRIMRDTENLNTSIITNDKVRAAKQLEIEHNRRV